MTGPERLAGAAWDALSSGGGPADPEVTAGVVRVALEAVAEAGALHLHLLGRIRAEDVGRKSSRRDLVTEADVGAERLVVERLRGLDLAAAIEAEEETSDAASEGLRWFLDPLDGTVNFVHGIPMFSVSLALYRGPVPLFGVVLAPRLALETAVNSVGTNRRNTTLSRRLAPLAPSAPSCPATAAIAAAADEAERRNAGGGVEEEA